MQFDDIGSLGRYSGPATLILASLAGGAKHGYALMLDIEDFASVTLRPGTLYGALSRLENLGLIESLEGDGRRRPYRLTSTGAHALEAKLLAERRIADVGLERLYSAGSTS